MVPNSRQDSRKQNLHYFTTLWPFLPREGKWRAHIMRGKHK